MKQSNHTSNQDELLHNMDNQPENDAPSTEVAGGEVTRHRELFCITPLAKYLVIVLMLVLSFLGGYVGYMLAPEKVVEVEKAVEVEKKNDLKKNSGDSSGWALRLKFETDGPESVQSKPNNHKVELCQLIREHDFIRGEMLFDEYVALNYLVPEGTKSISSYKNCPHSPLNEFNPHRTEITLIDGSSIFISHNGYFNEWNAGVPIATVSTTTVVVGERDYVLYVHDTYKWDEGSRYGDWEETGEPFAVVFLNNIQGRPVTMVQLPYVTEKQIKVSNNFLASIELHL